MPRIPVRTGGVGEGKRKRDPVAKRATHAAPPPPPRPDDGRSHENALRAIAAALEKKALEPVLLDVRDQSSYTDYILLVSGRSDRQVQSIADGIVDACKASGRRPIGVEGSPKGQWTLVDLGDVIVHVFHHPVREYYDLEGFWSDAKRVPIEIPAEARVQPTDLYDA